MFQSFSCVSETNRRVPLRLVLNISLNYRRCRWSIEHCHILDFSGFVFLRAERIFVRWETKVDECFSLIGSYIGRWFWSIRRNCWHFLFEICHLSRNRLYLLSETMICMKYSPWDFVSPWIGPPVCRWVPRENTENIFLEFRRGNFLFFISDLVDFYSKKIFFNDKDVARIWQTSGETKKEPVLTDVF